MFIVFHCDEFARFAINKKRDRQDGRHRTQDVVLQPIYAQKLMSRYNNYYNCIVIDKYVGCRNAIVHLSGPKWPNGCHFYFDRSYLNKSIIILWLRLVDPYR